MKKKWLFFVAFFICYTSTTHTIMAMKEKEKTLISDPLEYFIWLKNERKKAQKNKHENKHENKRSYYEFTLDQKQRQKQKKQPDNKDNNN